MEEKEYQGQEVTEEDLIDFELDDLDLEDGSGDTAAYTDEEILELVDLVERGEKQREEARAESKGLIKEEEPGESEEQIAFTTDELSDLTEEFGEKQLGQAKSEGSLSDLSLSDLTLEAEEQEEMEEDVEDSEIEIDALLEDDSTEAVDFGIGEREGAEGEEASPQGEISETELETMIEEAPTQLVELELEGAGQQGASELESEERVEEPEGLPRETIQDFEEAGKSRGEKAELAKEAQPEEGAPREPEEAGKSPEEGLKVSEAIAAMGEPTSPEEVLGEAVATGVGLSVLTDERIEEIVTRVVTDVLERVARETMAEVAERVIGEAIETLKKSIESNEG